MKIKLSEEYKGQLGLQFDQLNGVFHYTLIHYTYPNYECEVLRIQEGDLLTVRSPHDATVVISRVVEFDYETGKVMHPETGQYHQRISGQPVNGVLTNIEPTYWFNLFANGYFADLKREH